jgi:hypothetical protein
MFLEVQSHMCFTAWDDATGGEGLLMGSRRETGEKNRTRVRKERSRGKSPTAAGSIIAATSS